MWLFTGPLTIEKFDLVDKPFTFASPLAIEWTAIFLLFFYCRSIGASRASCCSGIGKHSHCRDGDGHRDFLMGRFFKSYLSPQTLAGFLFSLQLSQPSLVLCFACIRCVPP